MTFVAHPLLVLALVLLGWTGALGVISLANEIEPAPVAAMAAATGGSGTLAIALLALALVLAVCGAALAGQRLRDKSSGLPELREIRNVSFIVAELDRLFPRMGFKKWQLRRADIGDAAYVRGRTIVLKESVVANLREGRDGDPARYDGACFILLHEIAHARTGDLYWRSVRDALCLFTAGTLSVLAVLNANLWVGTFIPLSIRRRPRISRRDRLETKAKAPEKIRGVRDGQGLEAMPRSTLPLTNFLDRLWRLRYVALKTHLDWVRPLAGQRHITTRTTLGMKCDGPHRATFYAGKPQYASARGRSLVSVPTASRSA